MMETAYRYFNPTGELLLNPHIGFQTFQRFNGDKLNPAEKRRWTEGFPIDYQDFSGSLKNEQFPDTTVAYWRVYWRYFEPEEGMFDWDFIDKALATAKARGQTLMLRLPPYGMPDPTLDKQDVPDWLRKYVGPRPEIPVDKFTDREYIKTKCILDTNHPAYAHYYARAIAALARRYDMDPRLDSVDIGVVGPWGEDAGIELMEIDKRNQIVDAYLNGFKNTPLIAQTHDMDTAAYINSRRDDVGLRADCLGDMSKKGDPVGWGWAHMLVEYPFRLGLEGIRDMWMRGPISFEACGVMYTWLDRGYDIDAIIDQSLKWHISTFNAKSSPVPEEWMPSVERWLKKMGYRYAVRTARFDASASAGGELNVGVWWENNGVAPCYRRYPLYYRLKNDSFSHLIETDADIRKWLPGDSLVSGVYALPDNLPAGEYMLQTAILDPLTREPLIRLACDAPCDEGFYTIGSVRIV